MLIIYTILRSHTSLHTSILLLWYIGETKQLPRIQFLRKLSAHFPAINLYWHYIACSKLAANIIFIDINILCSAKLSYKHSPSLTFTFLADTLTTLSYSYLHGAYIHTLGSSSLHVVTCNHIVSSFLWYSVNCYHPAITFVIVKPTHRAPAPALSA